MKCNNVESYHGLEENLINGTVPFETDPESAKELLKSVISDPLSMNNVKKWKVTPFITPSREKIYLVGLVHQFQGSFETAISHSNGFGTHIFYE